MMNSISIFSLYTQLFTNITHTISQNTYTYKNIIIIILNINIHKITETNTVNNILATTASHKTQGKI